MAMPYTLRLLAEPSPLRPGAWVIPPTVVVDAADPGEVELLAELVIAIQNGRGGPGRRPGEPPATFFGDTAVRVVAARRPDGGRRLVGVFGRLEPWHWSWALAATAALPADAVDAFLAAVGVLQRFHLTVGDGGRVRTDLVNLVKYHLWWQRRLPGT